MLGSGQPYIPNVVQGGICLPAGRVCQREESPLFRKEGRGEIFRTIYLPNYGLVSRSLEGEKMLRVLIVEDNKIFREVLKRRLDDNFQSIVVEEAANSEEALQEINKGSPHLIFMDIHLPGMNGLQLTQKVKKDSPDIRIAILTDYDLPEYREAARQFGADRFFVKSSFEWDEVETLVRSISPDVP